MKAEILLAALNKTQLITGAWEGMAYDDLPEHVQEALTYISKQMNEEVTGHTRT